MTRKCFVIFCDNEHGCGQPKFPDLDTMTPERLEQAFIEELSASTVRRAAKTEGWGRVNGADYCPACMESM